MLKYSKTLISIIMILNILESNNICMAANYKNENLTTKSYVFDLDDLESSEIKELYNLKEDEIPLQYNLNDKIELFVEDQEATDLCDLFACIKSIETNYALTTGSSIDLSERYMDYISSKYLVLVKKRVGKYSIIYTASKLCVAMSFTV